MTECNTQILIFLLVNEFVLSILVSPNVCVSSQVYSLPNGNALTSIQGSASIADRHFPIRNLQVARSLAFLNFGQQAIFNFGLFAAMVATAMQVFAGVIPVGKQKLRMKEEPDMRPS